MKTTPVLLLAALIVSGCSHEGRKPLPPEAAAGMPPAAASVTSPSSEPSGPRVLHHADVAAAVVAGLGAFLGHVDLRAATDGGFVGWEVNALRPAAAFRGVDLRVGDIVLSINGNPIERPDQALQLFQSMNQAHEIRLAILRDGHPVVTTVSIVE